MIGRIALAGALAVGLGARAWAQDVDELKKRYKNMPGGDMIAAQLEAHRAQIEAANAKRNAQMAKMGYDKPAKSPEEILALIPAPAKTVAEAKKRRGKVDNGNGGKTDGDAKCAPAVHELYAALAAGARGDGMAPMGGGGIVPPGQGETMKKLDGDTRSFSQEADAGTQAFIKASRAAEDEQQKAEQAVWDTSHKKLAEAGCDDEGEGRQLSAAQTSRCAALKSAYASELGKRRQAYLDTASTRIAEFRKKTESWVARGASIDSAAKTVTAPALQGPVSMFKTQAKNVPMQALIQLTGAESDAVLKASEKVPTIY